MIPPIKKRKESPARDANYKMADGGAPENDHQQMSSEGGNIGGAAAALANAQRRRNEGGQSAYTVEHLEGDNMPYARGLGLGDHLLKQAIKQAKRKAKAVEKALEKAAAVAFEMEVLAAVLEVPPGHHQEEETARG
jgi:hypothetical protein